MKNFNTIDLRYLIIVTLVSLFAFSCRNSSETPVVNTKPGVNEMEELNRYLIQKDRELIQNYAERKKLTLTESPAGLWYQIIYEGDGSFYTDADKVIFDYECSLLDGTKCYSSKTLGPKEVVIGRSQLEPGLNEGFRMLRPGGSAIFVIPPFLAYGLPGDGKMIPSRAIIVYNVNILRPK